MKKGVSKRYSDKELSNFKEIIVKKIETAQADLKLLKDLLRDHLRKANL